MVDNKKNKVSITFKFYEENLEFVNHYRLFNTFVIMKDPRSVIETNARLQLLLSDIDEVEQHRTIELVN